MRALKHILQIGKFRKWKISNFLEYKVNSLDSNSQIYAVSVIKSNSLLTLISPSFLGGELDVKFLGFHFTNQKLVNFVHEHKVNNLIHDLESMVILIRLEIMLLTIVIGSLRPVQYFTTENMLIWVVVTVITGIAGIVLSLYVPKLFGRLFIRMFLD